MNKHLAAQRFELAFKAVHLQCLDKNGAAVAEASGFIRREGGALYLYTCWHVATGRSVRDTDASPRPPYRVALAVTLYDMQPQSPEVSCNARQLHVPLYDTSGRPLWFQDRKDDPQTAARTGQFRVPHYHDAIKLRLPADACIAKIQAVDEECYLKDNTVMPGDKVLLAGYPRGYGLPGEGQPFPVVLTRFIAAPKVPGNRREALLDGCGAPGMAGCPVFLERDSSIYLLGVYTGPLLPAPSSNGGTETALGLCCDLSVCWKRLPLQPYLAPA